MKKMMILLTLSLAACGLSEPSSLPLSPANDATDELPVLSFTTEEAAGLSTDDGWPSVEPAVCQCQEAECIDAWIRDVIGCDVCVVVACADDKVGACSMCEQSAPAADAITSVAR